MVRFPAWELNPLLSGAFEEPEAGHAIFLGRSMEVETDGVVWIVVILAILRLSLKGSEIAENNISSANAQTTEKLLLMFRFQHGFVSLFPPKGPAFQGRVEESRLTIGRTLRG